MNKQVTETAAVRAAHSSLYQALAAAQAEMGPALKDSVNPAFKSRYADLASVMAACIPALSAHGIAVLQPPCEIDGTRCVKTILAHESGETAECVVPLIVQKNDMQGYGSAVTYARRYGLMAMAGIAPDDDDGNAAAAAAPKKDARPAFDAAKAEERIAGLIAAAQSDADLTGLWQAEAATIRQIGSEGEARIIAAFKARKAALQQPADLAGDSIPY